MNPLSGGKEEIHRIKKLLAKYRWELFLSVLSSSIITFQTNQVGLIHRHVPSVGALTEISATFIVGLFFSVIAWVVFFIACSITFNLLLAAVAEVSVHNSAHHFGLLIKHPDIMLAQEAMMAVALIAVAIIFGRLLHRRVKSASWVVVYSAAMGTAYLVATGV